MELVGVLSNSETAARLGRVRQAVADLPTEPGPDVPEPPPAQGEALRTIKTVLAGHQAGLRTIEIWQLVVARLGREVKYGPSRQAWSTMQETEAALSGPSAGSIA
jgi:hypothetical protein